jgi:hypothetical protein
MHNRTAEAPWPERLLGLGGQAPDHIRRQPRVNARLSNSAMQKSSPSSGSTRRHSTVKVFASKAAGTWRARGVT